MSRASLAIVALLVSARGAAWACTVCDSDTGQQVRSGIFNDAFWPTFAAVAAPFPILVLGLTIYQFGLPTFGKSFDTRGSRK